MPKDNRRKSDNRVRVNLSFSAEEYTELLSKIGADKITPFCKNAVLEIMPKLNKKTKTKYKDCDPKLLYQLSQIGNNLNQISRLAHADKKAKKLELISLISGIEIIREQLEEVRKNNAG